MSLGQAQYISFGLMHHMQPIHLAQYICWTLYSLSTNVCYYLHQLPERVCPPLQFINIHNRKLVLTVPSSVSFYYFYPRINSAWTKSVLVLPFATKRTRSWLGTLENFCSKTFLIPKFKSRTLYCQVEYSWGTGIHSFTLDPADQKIGKNFTPISNWYFNVYSCDLSW